MGLRFSTNEIVVRPQYMTEASKRQLLALINTNIINSAELLLSPTVWCLSRLEGFYQYLYQNLNYKWQKQRYTAILFSTEVFGTTSK